MGYDVQGLVTAAFMKWPNRSGKNLKLALNCSEFDL
jgi:hypothetical protein